jgi:predicted PurR-regulated permease PerM
VHFIITAAQTSDPAAILHAVPEERVVIFSPRTILAVIGIVLAVATILAVVWLSRQVLTWILVAVFLALALNPAVEFFQRQGLARRGLATAVTVLLTIGALVGLGSLFIPTLVSEARGFAEALPGYVNDVSEGRGPLGRLVDRYEIEQKVRDAVAGGGGIARVLGLSGTAIAVTKGVLTFVVAVVTIAFMTFFMLLEGPTWVERFFALLPERSRDTWRKIGYDIYRTVGGYVTGNLVISVIAGIASTIVLLIMDVPYAVALGVLVAILDLIPLAGATLAAIIVSTVAFIESLPAGIVVLLFFIAYQQLENHVLQPLVYSRTVQLSPLAILISVLIGAKLAGILGALAAIPVAGTIQVLLLAWLAEKRRRDVAPAPEEPAPT